MLLFLRFLLDGYPRIASDRLLRVVILRNDNASGIVHLSSSAVAVKEGDRGAFLYIIRSGGIFGEVYRIVVGYFILGDGCR